MGHRNPGVSPASDITMPDCDRPDPLSPTPEPFVDQVRDAYDHLYDLVYLRSHPLLPMAVHDGSLSRQQRAWQLHERLIAAVDELDPGPQAPVLSREWRRHRLIVLRYLDGLSPEETADRLAISLRQLYRELANAMQAIATVIWDRCEKTAPAGSAAADLDEPGVRLDRVELLRLEAARASTSSRHARLAAVIDGLLPLLAERLAERQLEVQLDLPAHLPSVSLGQSMVRQMLLALCGHLIERARHATLLLAAYAEQDTVLMTINVAPASSVSAPPDDLRARLDGFAEMARASRAALAPLDEAVSGFMVRLPYASTQTLLAIDDNQDSLDLLARILQPEGYTVVQARSAHEGLDLAVELKPLAITLDLMMPGQDGWDLLHKLLERDDTRGMPIIVCSVLQQRELALSLGATAFLRKPVDEATLLALLNQLRAA